MISQLFHPHSSKQSTEQKMDVRQEIEQRSVVRLRLQNAALKIATHVVGMVVIVVALLGIVTIRPVAAQSESAAPVQIRLGAPTHAKVGEAIRVKLYMDEAPAIGGFDALFTYARQNAEFAAFSPSLPADESGIGELIAPELAMGSAVGFYSCTTAQCMRQRTAIVRAAAEPGVLGEIELIALSEGALEVRVAQLNLVDRSGQPIAYSIEPAHVVVQVGVGEQALMAPTSTWQANVGAAGVTAATATTADVTQDGRNSHGDIMEVALAWAVAHESGDPCVEGAASAGVGPAAVADALDATNVDVNGDGCVTIADVQMAAAFAGAQQPLQGAEEIYLPQVTTEMESNATAIADEVQEVASVYTVNSVLDESDSNVADGICQSASQVCTLRAAIHTANAHEGADVIKFAIPGNEVHTIQLTGRLPSLRDETGGTTIDGYSQAGATANSDPLVSNAQIRIEVRGDGYAAFDGLPITSAQNIVRGIAFYNLKRSIWLYGIGAYGNLILGSFIGTNAAGTFFAPTVSQDQAHGIHVEQGALGNQIGGEKPAQRNIISGNARHGVGFWHVGTDENLVINNIVGLSPDGLRRVSNRQQGVDINYGASFNRIGGTKADERNVISGNGENGAEITHGAETTENSIIGNYIGTNVTGEGFSGTTINGGYGISLHDRVQANEVISNVVGNNRKGGLLLDDFNNCCVSGNRVEGNWIGVSPGGMDIGNSNVGVQISATLSTIGPGNFIAYNPVGVRIEGDEYDGNTITRNSIFGNTELGIDLAPVRQINLNDEGDGDTGPNEQLNFPVIQLASLEEATGTACGECIVEIFVADDMTAQYGQGKTFVGSAVADANGFFTATLENVAFGDYLTATATDFNGNTSEFSRNFLISNPANLPPIAVNDSATTQLNRPVLIDVLANDSDPEGDAVSLVTTSQASEGSTSNDGALVTFTPTVGFTGVTTFTYTVSDNIGGSSMATVTVTVVAAGASGAGVTIAPSEVEVMEGGSPIEYTIVLKSAPKQPVTITLISELRIVVVEPSELVFDDSNWNKPQSVTVQVMIFDEMSASESGPDQVGLVRHSVKSSDSDYNNRGVPNLTVNITESGQIYLPTIMSD